MELLSKCPIIANVRFLIKGDLKNCMWKPLNGLIWTTKDELTLNSGERLADQSIPQVLLFCNSHWHCIVTNITARFSHFKIKTLMLRWVGLVCDTSTSSRTFCFFLFFKSYSGQLKTPRSSWRNKPVDGLPCFHNPSRPGPYLFSESEIIFGLGAVAKNLKHWKNFENFQF